MSLKIGGFLNSLGGDNQIGSTPTFASKQTAGEYEGGSLMVSINQSDTQQTFARRGLHDTMPLPPDLTKRKPINSPTNG